MDLLLYILALVHSYNQQPTMDTVKPSKYYPFLVTCTWYRAVCSSFGATGVNVYLHLPLVEVLEMCQALLLYRVVALPSHFAGLAVDVLMRRLRAFDIRV